MRTLTRLAGSAGMLALQTEIVRIRIHQGGGTKGPALAKRRAG